MGDYARQPTLTVHPINFPRTKAKISGIFGPTAPHSFQLVLRAHLDETLGSIAFGQYEIDEGYDKAPPVQRRRHVFGEASHARSKTVPDRSGIAGRDYFGYHRDSTTTNCSKKAKSQ